MWVTPAGLHDDARLGVPLGASRGAGTPPRSRRLDMIGVQPIHHLGASVKIRVERDVLADAVQWVARSLPNRPSVPILAGLRIEASGAEVVLSTFDYETSAKVTVPADVTDDGVALVSGRLLADIARGLPAKPVDLISDDSRLEIICGSARFTLQLLPVAEYPDLPAMPASTGTLTPDVFAQAVVQDPLNLLQLQQGR